MLERRGMSQIFSDQKSSLRNNVLISLGCRVTLKSRASSLTCFGNDL